jgi:hypothetical protein
MDKAYQKKVVKNQEATVVKTALNIISDLSLQTPVRTGRARSNWLPSVGVPRTETTEQTGGAPFPNFSGYKLGLKIFIANNLPYIRRLNEGWSKQAPSAFVDRIVQVNTLRAKSVNGGIL